MTSKGIDVSNSQGRIDWKKVKSSGRVEFAVIRAGYGRELSQKDEQFENNYKGCKDNGIPVGAYWYSYADSVEDAKREARVCLEILKGKQFEYPIYYDIEEKDILNLGKSTVSAMATAFCEILEKAGYYVGVYTMKSGFEYYISDEVKNNHTSWLANVDVEKSEYSGPYSMWQYSWTGRINGINTNVDLDECYVDYPTVIKSKGKNGYKASGTVKGDANKDGKVDVRDAATIAHSLSKGDKLPKSADFNGDGKVDVRDAAAIAKSLSGHKKSKSVDEIAREVINGEWGNGEERRQRLTAAGYDYDEVQNAVNELI